MYPDLAEKKENKDSSTLAEVDLKVFAKHRTSVSEGAKIVRTEEGAFLAMAADMSIRRYCHMHKFTYTKKCERPKCDRFIFPQLHPEAEIIGKAVCLPWEQLQGDV